MIRSLLRRRPNAEAQLRAFLDPLSQSRAEDLGLAVAAIEHLANSWFIYGDFYKPKAVLAEHPEAIQTAITETQRLQASGLQVMAVGWIAWAHTFRATQDQGLLPLAKSMWTLLIRGAPYADGQRATLLPILGFELRVENPYRIPEGFADAGVRQ